MPVASRYAKALWSVLGLNNGGEQPRNLTDQIVPTIDVTQHYLLDCIEVISGVNPGATVNGFNGVNELPAGAVPLVVPIGEVWRLWLAQIVVTTGAGVSGKFAAAIAPQGTGTNRFIITDPLDAVASQGNWKLSPAMNGFWLTPGQRVGFELQQRTGGDATVSVGLVFSRLRA